LRGFSDRIIINFYSKFRAVFYDFAYLILEGIHMNRSSIFWGFILILIGVLFLLANLGILAIDVWLVFWPLVVIAFGFWMLAGVFLGRGMQEGERAVVPLDGAAGGRIILTHGGGRLFVGGNAEPGSLLSGIFGGGVDYWTRRVDGDLEVDMKIKTRGFTVFWWPGDALEWRVNLNSEVPLSLLVKTGASESHLELADLQVKDLKLETGASSCTITLPGNAGYTRARIESGVASVKVFVPQSAAARIHVSSGLSDVKVDRRRFTSMGNVYQSAEYETSSNKIDLEVETGVGSVSIR
jgi:hypothetical protein